MLHDAELRHRFCFAPVVSRIAVMSEITQLFTDDGFDGCLLSCCLLYHSNS